MNTKFVLLVMGCVVLFACSCSNSKGPLALFSKLTPHQAYGKRLKDAGLDKTAMGSSWLLKSESSVAEALNVSLPYKETGYFSAEKVPFAAMRFEAKRGQSLHVTLTQKPAINFNIYIDLLLENGTAQTTIVASADTNSLSLNYEVKQTAKYILRLQPELLTSGEYTVTIATGPSLGFPVSQIGKPNIGSFWGDGRDDGGRKHEGVDIFATRNTPAIAAANGVVTNVTENKLGGLVVFMRPLNRDYTLYYAHLDRQLVQSGQTVAQGDTIGLVGNTGNARTTPPHLHFGIYTGNGAVDPYPYLNPVIKSPAPVSASLTLLSATARTIGKATALLIEPNISAYKRQTLPVSTTVSINAATGNWYKVTLPNGTQGFISNRNVVSATALRKYVIKRSQPLLDKPDSATAASKATLLAGNEVSIKGIYSSYYLVTDNNDNSGWIEVGK